MNRCPRLHAWCSGVKRFYEHRGKEGGLQKEGVGGTVQESG